ncbi:GNAT family protein [Streptomyces sp. WI04-05B]|uniref:GNAT family N-acetyltransferase n=1 Tax=Streptomyces TaxID=1883 RepID=UPI0029A2C083|nr:MULTISPECIES: GNAT family protein [unclassified Streptomyces]MDX2542288.1 GNAT family protein [Streptomyces sp. WI04-05B]MDX2584120.1 GNAT family protein [Streptomyces sp. WI04-05A]MDX3751178.1 GNAT family protein [Streptomyces sp. AK08-02]
MTDNMTDNATGKDDDVRLRDVTEADLEFLFVSENDPEAVRRSRFTPRPRDAFMRHWKSRILGDSTVFVQLVTVDGEPAGSIVAWWEGEQGVGGDRFVGYWLARPYWGRGVGTVALGQFLRRETHRPLYADPFAGNTASVRLLEKHGFRRTGTVRHGEDEHIMLVLGSQESPAGS